MIYEPEEAKLFVFWMILFLAVGWFSGWVHAHHVVAKECQRLGGFYVGGTTYKCAAEEPTP